MSTIFDIIKDFGINNTIILIIQMISNQFKYIKIHVTIDIYN